MVVVIHLRATAYYLMTPNVLNSSVQLVQGPAGFFKVTSLQRKHSLLCPVNDLKKQRCY